MYACVCVCASTTTPRFDSHDLSSSFFLRTRRAKSAVTNSTCRGNSWRREPFCHPRQIEISDALSLPFSPFTLSFPPSPPPSALFPSTSFPPLLARSFRKTFRSHWDKSIFQLLKLIEYRFWCSLEQSAPCCIRWCYTSWNVIIVPTNFPTYAFSTARSKLVIII